MSTAWSATGTACRAQQVILKAVCAACASTECRLSFLHRFFALYPERWALLQELHDMYDLKKIGIKIAGKLRNPILS